MTTPAPTPAPDLAQALNGGHGGLQPPGTAEQPAAIPETGRGLLGHLEDWIATHFAPELARARADAARALESTRAHAAQEEAIANLVVGIVSAADPAAAPVLAELLPEAKRVLAEAERLVGEFAGPQM
jgi:hypothetical protein